MTILASSGNPEYKILSAITADTLTKLVNQHFADGWTIYGSLVVSGNNIMQPMMRRVKEVALDDETTPKKESKKKESKKTTDA